MILERKSPHTFGLCDRRSRETPRSPRLKPVTGRGLRSRTRWNRNGLALGDGVNQDVQETTFFIVCIFLLLLGGSRSRMLQLLGLLKRQSLPGTTLWTDVAQNRFHRDSAYKFFVRVESMRGPLDMGEYWSLSRREVARASVFQFATSSAINRTSHFEIMCESVVTTLGCWVGPDDNL